ncbi:SusE domain-containing protein [Duncaniella sp.]|uniref:SusE domain-containing protein n=1 Tax=Duncaniella sp. TaxID=2518496 RepID=UPI0023CEC02A|nr:SusE domain-containing protein [Duncaniella sp.]MDE5904147.1 SusE domain-containing protein [Duncaniella sp.]
MKKLYILASLAVAAASLTSCEADKEPVYVEPAEKVFALSAPAEDDNIVLAPGQVVELTAVAPDYGIPLVTTYSVDLTLADEFIEANEETGTEANYITLTPKQPTKTAIELDDKDVTTAICQLLGINTFKEFEDADVQPQKVTVRANARIPSIASSNCVSNSVVLPSVTPYNPYPEVGRTIYIVGALTGWGVDAATPESFAKWGLNETGVGTNIYVGAFDMPAGKTEFRFYTELGSWGENGQLPSIGPKPNDGEKVEVTFTDEAVKHTAVPGKGSWYTPETWEGGYVTFTVDMTDKDAITVTMQKGNWDTSKLDFIYIVGDCSAWSVDAPNAEEIYANYKLYDWDGNGVYYATFEVAKGKANFRFYTELGSWGEDGKLPSIGAKPNDSSTEIALTDGVYSGACVEGKGNWSIPAWEGGKMKFTVDVPNMTVKFEAVE